jgi:erythromycin esterase-like protein
MWRNNEVRAFVDWLRTHNARVRQPESDDLAMKPFMLSVMKATM